MGQQQALLVVASDGLGSQALRQAQNSGRIGPSRHQIAHEDNLVLGPQLYLIDEICQLPGAAVHVTNPDSPGHRAQSSVV